MLFSGALRHIRNRWPSAHITLCTRSFGRELFAHCPYVDELVSYEKLFKASPINWIPAFRGSKRLRHALHRNLGRWLKKYAETGPVSGMRCDLALLPMLAPQEDDHHLMMLIPASMRLGVRGSTLNQSRKSEVWSRRMYSAQMDASALPWDFSEIEATSRFLQFMRIDADVSELWPEFWVTDSDARTAEKLMELATGHVTLGIAPGVASVPGKNLPPEWFARAIGQTKAKAMHVVLLGSAADMQMCEGVSQAIRGVSNVTGITNLAGKTKVREMIECVRRCDLLLTQETAALHMATALRRPVVGIVGGGHFGRFYPWGDPATSRLVNKPMDCYGCNWRCKYRTIRCIQEISPSEAAREINVLLENLQIR